MLTAQHHARLCCACHRFTDATGIGIWPHTGTGYYAGTNGIEEFAWPAISLAPNPVECLWVGPMVSDLDCSTCILGYETTSANDTTCLKPAFGPNKKWAASAERAGLQLEDADGVRVEPATNASGVVLLAGHTYRIPAPALVPKERKFAGYAQPDNKIHYELDFSLGADVDIGCGTAVTGDGGKDKKILKTVWGHPLSQFPMSYQFTQGRDNPNAVPPYPGHYTGLRAVPPVPHHQAGQRHL